MSNHSQIQINASLQTTLSILPFRRFTLHSSVSSSSYFLFFFFEFSLPSFPSFLSKSISLPSGSLPSLVCLVNVRVYTRVKRACACGVYTRYSHPLNSTWHKQQSLCKKKGTIFVKRNIHALYHVSSPSRSPSLPPTPCFFFRETRGKGETPSLCCEISSRIRWMYYPPFVLIFFFVLLFFFFFCRYISCACFRRFVRNYWNTRIQ